MKTLKRLFLTVLVLSLAAAAFATGQSEGAGATAGDIPDAAIVNRTGFPIVNEPVTLTMAALRGEMYADREGWAWLEDLTNVHIELEMIPLSAYHEKVNIKLATNDMNDIMDVGELGDMRKFADDGFFYPLNGLIEEYGDATGRWIEARPNVWEFTKGSDGLYYGWPWTTAESPLSLHRHLLWVERNWLENVGMEPPTTTDEFYEMLVAFKEMDANGNGDPNDEIPFSSSTPRPPNDYSSPLIAAWLYAYEWLQVEDGTVSSPLTSDAFKEAIAWQAMLFEEGLMYEESLTQDRGTQWQVNEQSLEYNTIGCVIGQHQNYAMSWDSPKWKDYIALEPLEGPDGVKFGVWTPPIGRIDIVINADTEYPATAFRWMDYLYTEEGSLARYYGLEGVHWEVAEQGLVDIAGNPATWTNLVPDSEENTFAINGFIQSEWGGIGGVGDRFSLSANPEDLNPDGHTKNQVRFLASQVMGQYVPPIDEQWVPLPVDADIVEEYSIVKTNVMDVVKQFTSQFIAGQRPMSEWDVFMNELDRAGLERYVELSQIAYDRFNE